jgi:hypothetical protein
MPSLAWNKLYRAALFKNIRFIPGLFSEDMAIMPDLFFRAGKVASVSEAYYYYNCRERSSITFPSTSLSKMAKMKYGHFAAWRNREEKAGNLCPEDRRHIEKTAIRFAIGALALEDTLAAPEREECRAYLAQKAKGPVLPNIGAKWSFLWWCLDHCPPLSRLYPKFSQLSRLWKIWRIRIFRNRT